MAYKSLKDIYGFLRPSELEYESTGVKSLGETLMKLHLDPRGEFFRWDKVKSEIESHFKGVKSGAGKEEKRTAGLNFHAIGTDGVIDLGDSAYWGAVKSIGDISPRLNSGDLSKIDCKVSAFISRDPMTSPATRGVDQVEFFLNYIPPVMASQMVPYLDVELEFLRPYFDPSDKVGMSKSAQSTPSMMRFLLGSIGYSALNKDNRAIAEADFRFVKSSDGKKSIPHSYSGMEMFLMPQSLTNMEGLLPDQNQRLVRAKPFVPFASIEGFDVTIQNAGAGAFAHKKGNLKLKLHDKARISEFAEFIKGGPGFNSALVWTTYGWLAPRGRGEDDAYAKFINDNMLTRDCWQIVNSQFTFDAAGQVSFTVEMVSKATRALQQVTLDRGTGQESEDVRRAFDRLEELLATVRRIKENIENAPKFTIDVTSQQVLNAAATTGYLGDIKDVQQAVNVLLKSLEGSKNPAIKKEDVSILKSKLNELKGDNNIYNQVKSKTEEYVKKKFKQLSQPSDKPDPFLPRAGKEDYFPGSALLTEINEFKNRIPKVDAALVKANNEAKKSNPKGSTFSNFGLSKDERVVSFGKLFMSLVAPGIVGTRTCNELQVFFYGLNDECGPLSNHSIAEFPIDMNALAYAYEQTLKEAKTDVLTLEQFLKIVVNTQFADIRSIGYGMSNLYKVGVPGNSNPEREEGEAYQNKYAEWIGRYGSFKPPMIEFILESGDESSMPKDIVGMLKKSALQYAQDEANQAAGSKRIIKRIHIYDKQCNPYKLMQQYIAGDNTEDLERGFIDSGKLELLIKSKFSGLDANKQEKIRNAIRGLKTLDKVNAELQKQGAPTVSNDELNSITRRPGRSSWQMHRDRKSFKSELQRYVPTITIGTNGTMVISANMSSKTDGLMGAINIMNSLKDNSTSAGGPPASGLEDAHGLPLRVVPMGLQMTTLGCPIANLYQEYFIDFDTGTTIDNLYKCNTLTHSISQGKFTTAWGFIYSNGYGKFGAAPSKGALVVGAIDDVMDQLGKSSGGKQPAAPGAKNPAQPKAPATPAKK